MDFKSCWVTLMDQRSQNEKGSPPGDEAASESNSEDSKQQTTSVVNPVTSSGVSWTLWADLGQPNFL